jgi:hypothetical protein
MRGAQPPGRSPAPVARYQPAPPQQYQPQQPQGFVQQQGPQPQQDYTPPPPNDYDSTTKQGQASLSDLLALQSQTGRAKGGIAHRTNPNPCPSCGSKTSYVENWGARRGPQPAPHCLECGYNGLFEQGLQSAWIS